MPHPLNDIGLHIADFKGFGSKPSGFDIFKPVNIVIGRNNSGKSALIDAIDLCISKGKNFEPLKHARKGSPFSIHVTQTMDERSLRSIFSERVSGGTIGGNHWEFAKPYEGVKITRAFGPGWEPRIIGDNFTPMQQQARDLFNELMRKMHWPLDRVQMIRLAAERDVSPEPSQAGREVMPNGQGTTNLIRAFLLSDNLPREQVEVNLLSDLNEVYNGDCQFSQILVREDSTTALWEIFLREEEKGDIRLSQSGSSLKSIFILLAMLRLIPVINKTIWSKVVFAVEEPENNLHPSLLRRLLNFLANQRDLLEFSLIITTHSPVCIDWSTKRKDSQILHVQHKVGESSVRAAVNYTHSTDILDDLDVRASDILQANGVIWVEGPSDRIYIKHWLEIISDGELLEGVHYTTMFYGGKVLAHFDALPPEESAALVSLMSLNRNAALLMDSDRHYGVGFTKTGKRRKPRMHINSTKTRIRDELERVGGFIWITEGREVENYIPQKVLSEIGGKVSSYIGIYEDIPALPSLAKYKENKVAIAHAATSLMSMDNISDHLDLKRKLIDLAMQVRKWNSMPIS